MPHTPAIAAQLARLRTAYPALAAEMADAWEPIRLLISTACPEIPDGSDAYEALIDALELEPWWSGDIPPTAHTAAAEAHRTAAAAHRAAEPEGAGAHTAIASAATADAPPDTIAIGASTDAAIAAADAQETDSTRDHRRAAAAHDRAADAHTAAGGTRQ